MNHTGYFIQGFEVAISKDFPCYRHELRKVRSKKYKGLRRIRVFDRWGNYMEEGKIIQNLVNKVIYMREGEFLKIKDQCQRVY